MSLGLAGNCITTRGRVSSVGESPNCRRQRAAAAPLSAASAASATAAARGGAPAYAVLGGLERRDVERHGVGRDVLADAAVDRAGRAASAAAAEAAESAAAGARHSAPGSWLK